jgi:hypothetical protein
MPSVGAVSVASTCSSPPALASACCGSGGGKSGSVASASGAGSWGMGSSRAAGSGVGIEAASFDLRGAALVDLIKQTQLYHHTSQKELNVYYAIGCKLTVSTSS